MKMLKLPLGDPPPRQLALLPPVLAVLVEKIHARKGEDDQGFHKAGPSAPSADTGLWRLVKVLELAGTLGWHDRHD